MAPCRLALPLLALLGLAAPAAAQVRSVELYAPRPFGWLIGDALALRAEIVLDAPYALDPASLPQPRPLDYWLDLKQARLTDRGAADGRHRYTLELVYQTFYAPLEPRRLVIPAMSLSAVDGAQRAGVDIPSWSFVTSPLRALSSAADPQAMVPRPDLVPQPIPTRGTAAALAATLALALVASTVLAWQAGWGPFGRRRSRPFSRAARGILHALARSSTSLHSLDAYRDALRSLHRAFDSTSGKGVFAEDLPAFLAAHPAFRAAEPDIRRLFDASRRTFFGEDPEGAARALPPADLAAIARRLRSAERAGA